MRVAAVCGHFSDKERWRLPIQPLPEYSVDLDIYTPLA
jgi:hypothetical protein